MLPRYVQSIRAVQFYLIFSVMVVALICGTLQALLFPLSFLSRRTWERISQWLAYNPLAMTVFCAEVLGRVKVRTFGDHAKTTDLIAGRLGDHLMASLNHVGDIDWLIGFCLLDRAGLLGKLRAVAKDVIKFIPGFGWSFYFSDWIFVKRDSSRDLSRISESTRRLASSPSRFVLAILPEGTRFTPEKHRESAAVAGKKGLPVYRHHLTPRARGFHALVSSLCSDVRTEFLVDISILTPEGATVGAVLAGEEIVCDVMLTYYRIRDIPVGSEKESGDWLYELFRRKDEQVDFHRQHGLFPGTPVGSPLPGRCRYYGFFWLALSSLPLLSLGLRLVTGGHYLLLAGCLVGVWGLGRLLDRLVDLTRIDKSSKYGKSKQA